MKERNMSGNKIYDFFIDELLSSAVKSFHDTRQYELLREKLDQMDRDCEFNFTDDAREFATECFELLLDISGQQEYYVYRQGLRDCVTILKRLGVLV